MQDEDEVWSYIQDVERGAQYKGEVKGRAEGEAERNQLQTERNKFKAERDQLKSKHDQIKAEHDQIKAEHDQIKAEREKEQINMVVNMRKAKIPVETISTITGLSHEQIEEILKEVFKTQQF